MAEPQRLQITLQPDGVAAPAQRVVLFVTEAVGTTLRALENDSCEHDDAWDGGSLGYRFTCLDLPPHERREALKNWVLAKGFQDLARGIRETLEEALFFIKMLTKESGVLTTWAQVEADIAAIRTEAAKLTFPALMERVNAGLREPMAFEAEFQSLQKARNCLEHRGGRVGPKDVDQTTQTLTLSFPRLKMFYMRGDEEIELQAGEVIDTHSPDSPFGKGDVQLFMRRVTRSREYQLSEPVIIAHRDFLEIAMACHMFAGDVASKLPSVGPKVDAVSQ
jgi:hypothetical protein